MKITSKKIIYSLVIVYILIVLYFTVVGRDVLECRQISLEPFCSVKEVMDLPWESHGQYILNEIILNLLLFMPIGVLLSLRFTRHGFSHQHHHKHLINTDRHYIPFRYRLLQVIVIGFLSSLTVETLQYITKTGTFATDDLIHNTFGIMLISLIIFWLQKMKRRAEHKLRKRGVVIR